MFFWNSLAFSMIHLMLAILVPLPFLNPAWTSGVSWFTCCWILAWRILSITLLVCGMSAIVWYFEHSLELLVLGNRMKTDLFQSSGHCWVFQICWHTDDFTSHLFSEEGQNLCIWTGKSLWTQRLKRNTIFSSLNFNLSVKICISPSL